MIPSTIAAITGLLSACLAGLTWFGAQRTKRSARDIDAIRVTQDALAETIQLQHEDNERLRARVRKLEEENRACHARIDRITRRLNTMGVHVDIS